MIAVRIELPSPLSDGVVVVRPMMAEDASPYAACFRDDRDLGRFLGLETDPDEQTLRDRIDGQSSQLEDGRFVELTIADPDSNAFWGSVLLHSFAWKHRRCEVGFWVVPAARRQGVASRSVTLVLNWAFNDLDLLRAEITTTPDNPAVPDLAERLGFRREGALRARNVERGERVDLIWFGLLREEWGQR
jgi:RimJ/RimL family protein N-acetyltransferase